MKLSAWTIIILGVAIAAATFSYGYFSHWVPNMEERGFYENYRRQLKAEADKRPQAVQRVVDAIRLVQAKEAEWAAVVATKTPPPTIREGGIDLSVSPFQLVLDANTYRNSLQRAINRQLKRGGVEVTNGPEIRVPDQNPAAILPTFFNYPAIAFPVVIEDLGTITVTGTYKQIKDHIASWSTMPNYLAVADGMNITGTSPNLTATYQVTIVGFIRAKTIHPPSPEGGGIVAAPAAPGGGGGGGRRGGQL